MSGILWWIFYFLTIYAFIPGFLSRVFGFRVFRRGRVKREIALTFDDGPDPLYTPQ
ncbi:polysaccharide deacetylase family protein, partial [Cohnella sp. CBP 2801]|nr:polysaccharide deacetylase family protein [Cohnella zeiphila]